jgi:hypothetical protein
VTSGAGVSLSPPSAVNTDVIDHSVHGLVTIRLHGASPAVLRGLVNLLGPSTGQADEQPDISVTFLEPLESRAELRFLGLNEAAFDHENFYLLDDAGRRTRIDFRTIGERCELACEPGVTAVPLLLPLVGLSLLSKGHVLLHAAAFSYRGKGTVVTGWQKGGKTELLLAFMAAGADYHADEWSIIAADGQTVYGLPSILHIWSWHLRHLPKYWSRLRGRERARLRLLRLYQRLYQLTAADRQPRRRVARFLRRLSLEGGISRIGQVRSAPERLFARNVSLDPARIERLFFATVRDGPTAVRRIDGAEVARRMVASLSWERRNLMAAYDQFRFAFPGRRNDLIEGAPERELELLARAFADRPAYEISHPYPVALDELLRAAAPLYDSR